MSLTQSGLIDAAELNARVLPHATQFGKRITVRMGAHTVFLTPDEAADLRAEIEEAEGRARGEIAQAGAQ